MLLQTVNNSSNKTTNFSGQISKNFYQQLDNISNTIISLQYDHLRVLSFRVSEVRPVGTLSPNSEETNMVIQCQIRGTTYNLTSEHIKQLNNRECRELFQQLGIAKN